MGGQYLKWEERGRFLFCSSLVTLHFPSFTSLIPLALFPNPTDLT